MMKIAKAVLARRGWEFGRVAERDARELADLSPEDLQIVRQVAPYTMTGPQRRASLLGAVDHIVRNRIEGDIVECGVWRGGSMLAVALALIARGETARELWLFDTFEGMSEPSADDRSLDGESAQAQLARSARDQPLWAVASLEDVQANLATSGYPPDRIHCVRGKVEETIPGAGPDRIALLRLDTDWYESTRHELEHLYPRLARHGVLIIDDYGHWKGARKAVDEYFAASRSPVFLHRVDYTARLLIKHDGP